MLGMSTATHHACSRMPRGVQNMLNSCAGPVVRREAAWRSAHEQAVAEAAGAEELKKELKKKIMDKFDLEVSFCPWR